MILENFKENHYDKKGTPKRYQLEAGFEDFKIAVGYTRPDRK